MRKINKLGRRAAALVLAVGLTLSTAAPVLAADADEVQTPAAQTEQQETDTEADEADVDTEADEAAALPELSEDREVAEEDEAAALPELSEDREVAEEDEAVALPELSEDRAAAGADEAIAARINWCDILGHKWGEEYGYEEATCQHGSYAYHKCERCGKVDKVDKGGVVAHKYTTYTVTKEATDGDDGEQVAYCDYGCETKKTQIIHYYGEWEVTKEATCYAKGEKKRTCLNCGYVETAEIKTIPHTWGEYVDDDKPGCQDQTKSQYCTVCGARNVDSETKTSGPVRKKHKFTHYEATDGVKVDGKWILITEMTAYCDYGCGEKDVVKTKDFGSGAEIAEIKGIDAAADSLADTVTNKINDALKKTEEAARNAETKEKAVDSLDTIYNETLAAIMGVKIGNYGVIDETTAKNLLSGLKSTMDSVKDTLNDSFLSKDSVQNSVSAIVSAATGEEGTAATKKSAYELLFSQARGALNKKMARMPTPLSTIWC